MLNKEIDLFDVLNFCAEYNVEAIDPTCNFFPGYPEIPTDEFTFSILIMLLACTFTFYATAQEKKRKGEVTGGLPPDATTLNIGDSAPDFELLGIDGKIHTLADYKSAKLLMVVFLSNHCPYSHAAETRLIPLAKEFKSQGLDVVSINPNSPESVRIDELGYSKYNDGYEDMKLYAKEAGFPFPYLYDGDPSGSSKGIRLSGNAACVPFR